MSLHNLLQNYFSVATSANAGIDTEGAVDRDHQLTVLESYKNKRGALQGVSKKDVVEIYGKKEDVTLFRLFYSLKALEVSSATFILTHKNPLRKITDFTDMGNIIVYQYVGQRDPVLHKTRNVPLEIYLERNDRWSL